MENVMETKAPDFRERLIGAQEMTPALREEFRRELDAVLYQRMTPRKRIETWMWIVAMLVLGGWCAYGLFKHHDPVTRIILPAFILFAIAHIIWLARALRRGGFAWRSNFKLLELWTGIAGIVLTVALFRGLRNPADPASTFGLLFTFIFYVCCAGMSLQNQIKSLGLSNREHLLRIESRLADLAERLGK
jgi:hypothetical protein